MRQPLSFYDNEYYDLTQGRSSDRHISQFVYSSANIIFVRKTLSVRPRDRNMPACFKLTGKDRRFSMKMMFADGFWTLAAACLNCCEADRFPLFLCLPEIDRLVITERREKAVGGKLLLDEIQCLFGIGADRMVMVT